MTLQIHKTVFKSGAKLQDVKAALKSVPEPKCTTEIPQDLTPENTVISLQREVLVLDIMHMPATIGWVGTKNLVTCLFLRIYNEEQEISFHVDSIVAPLNINALISQFRSQDNLKVMLLGGTHSQDSEDILNYILKALISASANMIVTYQKILDRNVAKDVTKYVFVRDLIMRKSAFLYRKLFNKTLDYEKMPSYPFSYFTHQDATDEAFNKGPGIRSEALSKIAVNLIGAFMLINEYVKPENLEKLDQQIAVISNMIKNESDFNVYIKLLFTKTAYEQLLDIYKDIVYDAELIHFAINIKTGIVHTIPYLFSTPYEAYRTVYLHDKQDMGDERAKRYFLAYDRCEHVMPALSDEIIKEVNLFYKHIDYKNDVSQFIFIKGYEFFRALSTIRMHDPEMKMTPRPYLLHFSDKKRFDASYLNSADAEKSAVLMHLNSHMPKESQFTAKIRQYPRHVVDAHLECKDWEMAKDMQSMLANKGIEAHILYQEKKLILCVAGINVDPCEKLRSGNAGPSATSPFVW